MSEKVTLKAEKREDLGKGAARTLRRAGRVPAVLYGRDLESVHLSVDAHDAATSSIDLGRQHDRRPRCRGEKKPYPTLVREIQTHPWKASLVHIDFLRIQEGVAVDLEIPVELVGIPVGVRLSGGVLEQIVHELEVRCIPSKIPESFTLDVSALDINDSLHVSDIPLTEGVEILMPPEQTICAVADPAGGRGGGARRARGHGRGRGGRRGRGGCRRRGESGGGDED
jgi:large subunit ribosomal protein L25